MPYELIMLHIRNLRYGHMGVWDLFGILDFISDDVRGTNVREKHELHRG